ncbi:MAG: sigma-54 dependent transcriptional regulator [Acidobacteria bacterium]|nr:sigma-54 dependent transcriptional regulator [Acidobacteriota bacterium]
MKSTDRILIAEDKENLRTVLRKTLEGEGYGVEEAENGAVAVEKIRQGRYSLVLTDLRLPRADGHQVLKAAVTADPEMPVILMTAYGTISDAVSTMKEGAYDYLEKPVEGDHLLAIIRRALQHRTLLRENLQLKERFSRELQGPEILGESPALRAALDQVRKVAPTDANVLLEGESGVGKELFALAVHHESGRKSGPFFAINCAAIPEALLESELFGYEKGAFTGASSTKRGKFEVADRGTLFLDEIGDLSPVLQGKVLRVIETKQFERVGGTQTRRVDIRLVAATNKDLKGLVASGVFRQDLYFRLSVFPICVPPLRERREDIPLLARHFLAKFAAEQKRRDPIEISHEALDALIRHAWPGNVRELENAIERALILGVGNRILPEDLNLPRSTEEPAA